MLVNPLALLIVSELLFLYSFSSGESGDRLVVTFFNNSVLKKVAD